LRDVFAGGVVDMLLLLACVCLKTIRSTPACWH